MFMVFDTNIQRYLPANKILANDIRETQASARSRPVSDEESGAQNREQQNQGQTNTQNPYQKPRHESKPLERAIVASQIMSNEITTIAQNSSIATARAIFRHHRFRHMPVTHADGKLAGILSDRDLMQHQNADDSMALQRIMRQQVLVAAPNTEIHELARVMYEQRVGAVPIIDEEEKLVGIVTRSDILRSLINHAPLELWI